MGFFPTTMLNLSSHSLAHLSIALTCSLCLLRWRVALVGSLTRQSQLHWSRLLATACLRSLRTSSTERGVIVGTTILVRIDLHEERIDKARHSKLAIKRNGYLHREEHNKSSQTPPYSHLPPLRTIRLLMAIKIA